MSSPSYVRSGGTIEDGLFFQSGFANIRPKRVIVGSGVEISTVRISNNLLSVKHFDFIMERLGSREETGMIEAVRQQHPGAYLIYGDWLEEQGRPLAAKMVREGWVP